MADHTDKVVPFPNLIQLYLRRVALALQEEDLEEAIRLLDEVIEMDATHSEAKQLRDSLVDQYQAEQEQLFQAASTIEIGTLELEQWHAGLLQPVAQKQWQTYEQMHSLMNEQVWEIIQEFMLYSQGDLLLKTKLLQQCKLTCPGSWVLNVEKLELQTTIKLNDVPVEMEDWKEDHLAPFKLLQETVYHNNPTLVEMARELWMYFLEKKYPFIPDLKQANKWTAALHSYTLKLMQQEQTEQELESMESWYQLNAEEIAHAEHEFAELLVQLPDER